MILLPTVDPLLTTTYLNTPGAKYIDEMLKPFLHTRNAAIKVQAITKGYLVRFNLIKHYHRNQIALNNSMYHRNHNMMTARWRYRADLVVQRALLSCNVTGGR